MGWSEERKEYFKNLFPDYHLGFLLMDSSTSVSLKTRNMTDFDYIVVSNDTIKYYVVFESRLHIGQDRISHKMARRYSRKDELSVVSKFMKYNGLYEKCLVFPYGREDKISKDLSYYFTEVTPINHRENMVYGFYDTKTQMIKAIK